MLINFTPQGDDNPPGGNVYGWHIKAREFKSLQLAWAFGEGKHHNETIAWW